MLFNLDIINVLVVLVALVNTTYGLVVYSRNRKDSTNLSFFILTLAVSAWGFSMFAYRGFNNIDTVVVFSRVLYVSAAAIPLAFLYFVFSFPHTRVRLTDAQKYLLPIPFIFIAAISLMPSQLIQTVNFAAVGERIIVFKQQLHFLYGLYIVGYFGAGYVILLRRFYKASDMYRLQLLYIFCGTIISTFVGVATNLILPFLGIFSLNWFGQVGVFVMIAAISYAILKHHLFNIRVIATEIFVATLWIFIFIRTFLSANMQEQISNSILLALTIIVGILLIRSVQQEVTQREKIEKLAKELEHSNLALEKANARLKELDQLKSEFVSLATHQIRGPLTAMKGYVSMIMEGDFGEPPSQMKDPLDKIYLSTQSLVIIVEDFLNVSRIEQGRMKYDFTEFDMRELAEQVVAELRPNITLAGLNFNVNIDSSHSYSVNADKGKIKQVISNLVDNSIKYTKQGSVSVTLDKDEGKIILKISDTGVGITADTMPKLFQKFSRASNASQVNTAGTGLGLYIASEMIKAHGGRIWAESEGAGKGSTFFVELPAAK